MAQSTSQKTIIQKNKKRPYIHRKQPVRWRRINYRESKFQ